jgi:hypothetical protein
MSSHLSHNTNIDTTAKQNSKISMPSSVFYLVPTTETLSNKNLSEENSTNRSRSFTNLETTIINNQNNSLNASSNSHNSSNSSNFSKLKVNLFKNFEKLEKFFGNHQNLKKLNHLKQSKTDSSEIARYNRNLSNCSLDSKLNYSNFNLERFNSLSSEQKLKLLEDTPDLEEEIDLTEKNSHIYNKLSKVSKSIISLPTDSWEIKNSEIDQMDSSKSLGYNPNATAINKVKIIQNNSPSNFYNDKETQIELNKKLMMLSLKGEKLFN